MIEKMKLVSVVASEKHKEELLEKIRELGLLHLAEMRAADSALTERFAALSRMAQELKEYAGGVSPAAILSDEAFETMDAEARTAAAQIGELEGRKNADLLEADKLRAWGDFDPEAVRALAESGLDFHFYRMGKKEFEQLRSMTEVRYLRLSSVDKMETVAVLGKLDASVSANEFVLPEKGLSALEAGAAEAEKRISAAKEILKKSAAYLSSYDAQLLKLQNRMQFSAADNTAESGDGLVWLTGYVPEADEARFVAAARENSWAYALSEVPEDDEEVPTKVKYNKVTALMTPIFDILGTVPGYREYDISFWFLCFFALFFAMIIGDAGYGMIFLIGAVVIHVKSKKLSNANLLLYVLSLGTIAWGSVTGTWLGLEGAMKVPFLKALVIPGFANYPEYFGVETTAAQNNVMKFCFSIGVTQLALACIMNVKRKLSSNDLSFLADLGWLSSICALYFMVLFLVIGEAVNVTLVAVFVAAGFLLVVLFGGMSPDKSFSQGLKAGVGDAFTVFLNTISAFGNVMSYIRLFAVGMASLAIAQSFNNMAAGFEGPLVVVGALIMLIGHVLNIVMGALSVVVHGVRLNLLEFSGQLGMEWSGTTYDPFRKLDKIKK